MHSNEHISLLLLIKCSDLIIAKISFIASKEE